MTLIVAALAPVVIILFYIYFRDKYEKEPIRLLLISLLLGAFIVLPVILFESLMTALNLFRFRESARFWNAGYEAFMVAALVEEGFKFLALYFLLWNNKNFNEKFDGIVYAVFISLGFAAVENIMYVSSGGMNVAMSRALTAVPAHALFGIRMGYFVGIARMYEEIRKPYLLKAFFYPFLLHGIYDFVLMAGFEWVLFIFIPYLIYLYFMGFRKMKILSDSSIYNNNVDLDNPGGASS